MPEILTPTPKPRIEITLEETPQGLVPCVTYHHMPGGWLGCHEVLCMATHRVAQEMVKNAVSTQQRIVLAQQLPAEVV